MSGYFNGNGSLFQVKPSKESMAGIRKYRKIAYVESESPAMVHPFAKISGICYGINWTRPVFHISTMTILKRLYKSHLSPTSPSTKPSSLSLFQISKQKPSKKKTIISIPSRQTPAPVRENTKAKNASFNHHHALRCWSGTSRHLGCAS